MTLFASFALFFAALSSSDAVLVLLNSPSATSPTRYAEAVAIVEKDAAAGKPLHQFVIGVTTKDAAKAKKYIESSRDKILKLAEERDNPLAWYLLSIEKNDVKLLKKAADGGNVQALNAYGSILLQSAIDKKLSSDKLDNVAKAAFGCFKRAAAQKDVNAFINLGTCYLRGFGCEMDHVLAFNAFRTAAEAGHPEGMDYLSASYEHGHGVEKNAELALLWYMKARAVRGDEAAKEWLKR